MERNLNNVSVSTSAVSTPDIAVSGNPDAWALVCKASSQTQGWMKSTKAMNVPGGCLVQVTTEHRHAGAVVACAEAITFVPGGTVAGLVDVSV